MSPGRSWIVIVVLVAVSGALGGWWLAADEGDGSAAQRSTAATGPVDANGVSTEIGWVACTFDDEEDPDIRAIKVDSFADYRCATVVVPLHHDDPTTGTLDLHVQMRPASGPETIGPLFVNQGGPGASAAQYSAAFSTSPELEAFDIVGMDPRGTGESTRVTCGGVGPPEVEADLPSPDDEGDELEVAYAPFVAACADDPIMEVVTTNNTARDMDFLRGLMGAEQLSYHGKSYGSDLGTAYASLFPERLRAGVFDGVSDLTLDPVEFVAQQAAAGIESLERYFERCRTEARSCAWTEGQDPAAAWDTLEEGLAEKALLDEESGEVLTDAGLRSWVHDSFDLPFTLRTAVLDALVSAGDFEAMVGESLAASDPGLARTFFSVTCQDLPTGPFAPALALLTAIVPNPPPDSIEVLAACARWPSDDPITVNAAVGAGPILVVGTTGDVPTPYASAVGLADALATAELLTWDADAHTSYFASACVAEYANRFLVSLERPPPGTACTDRSVTELAAEALAAEEPVG